MDKPQPLKVRWCWAVSAILFILARGVLVLRKNAGNVFSWLFLVVLTTSTPGYAASCAVLVVLAVLVTTVKGALFLVSRVRTSAFIRKINLLRDLSLVALAEPAQSGEGGLLVMHVCLKLLWHSWCIAHRDQDTLKQQQHLELTQQHQRWKNKMHSKE